MSQISYTTHLPVPDVVFVNAPKVGTVLEAAESFSEVESTKTISDLIAPVAGAGRVLNERLDETPELINEDPYGDGWICEITRADTSPLDGLLHAAAYGTLIGD